MPTISKPFPKADGVECVDFNEIYDHGNPTEKRLAKKLLTRAHKGIYCKTFPIPSEQEALSDWLDRLEKGDDEELQIFSVFGKNLNSNNPEIMGMIVSSYCKGTSIGLINYVIREKDYKGQLSGKDLCEHHEKLMEDMARQIDNQELKGILWEANDPAKIEWDENDLNRFEVDCMAPQKRVDHIEKNFGCKLLGFDYVQAPLSPCESLEEVREKTCKELLMYSYNADKYRNMTAKDLTDYLIVFSRSLNGASHPSKLGDEDITKMMNQLKKMEKDNIPLLKRLQTPEQQEALNKAGNDNEKQVLSPAHKKAYSNA